MIIKNANYGDTKNIMVCEMGSGDVMMEGSGKGKNNETVLALKTIKNPRPINVIEKATHKSFDDMSPELVFIFNKVESIDCMINMLKSCKKKMST